MSPGSRTSLVAPPVVPVRSRPPFFGRRPCLVEHGGCGGGRQPERDGGDHEVATPDPPRQRCDDRSRPIFSTASRSEIPPTGSFVSCSSELSGHGESPDGSKTTTWVSAGGGGLPRLTPCAGRGGTTVRDGAISESISSFPTTFADPALLAGHACAGTIGEALPERQATEPPVRSRNFGDEFPGGRFGPGSVGGVPPRCPSRNVRQALEPIPACIIASTTLAPPSPGTHPSRTRSGRGWRRGQRRRQSLCRRLFRQRRGGPGGRADSRRGGGS